MHYRLFAVTLAVLLATATTEENKKQPNPIIDFFEAPLKALRTKPGEAVAVFEPQLVKANQNSTNTWSPGQALGNAASSITDWLSQRVPLPGLTTTTPEPPVIVQVQSVKKGHKKPINFEGNRQSEEEEDEDDDEDDGDIEYNRISGRPSAVGSIYRHGFRNGVRNGARYGPGVPGRPGSPLRKRIRIGYRNGYNGYGYMPPNPYFYNYNGYYPQPQRPTTEIYFGPMRPVKRRKSYKKRPYQSDSKPQQQVQIVFPSQINDQLPLLIPVQALNIGGTPMTAVKKKQKRKPTRPIITQNDELSQELGGFTYIPIPLQQVQLQAGPLEQLQLQTSPLEQLQLQTLQTLQNIGVDSVPVQQVIPQLQVIAQHTHTIQNHGDEPQLLIGEDIFQEEDNEDGESRPPRPRPPRPPRPSRPTRPGRPSRPSRPPRPGRPSRPSRRPTRRPQSDPWADDYDYEESDRNEQDTKHKFDPNRHKPVILRVTGEQRPLDDKPDVEQAAIESYEGYDNVPNPFITVGEEEDEDEQGFQGRSDSKSQYYIPQRYYPLLGSDSYLAVSNNGRFLLKSGRGLNIDKEQVETVNKNVEGKPVLTTVEPADGAQGTEIVKGGPTENIRSETEKTEEIAVVKEISQDSDNKAEIMIPSKDTELKIEQIPVVVTEMTLQEENSQDNATPQTAEPISSPSTIIIEAITSAPKSEPSPEVALPHAHQQDEESKPDQLKTVNLAERPQVPHEEIAELQRPHIREADTRLKSEIIQEKPNGHFIVKSAVVDSPKVPSGRSHQNSRGNIKHPGQTS